MQTAVVIAFALIILLAVLSYRDDKDIRKLYKLVHQLEARCDRLESMVFPMEDENEN